MKLEHTPHEDRDHWIRILVYLALALLLFGCSGGDAAHTAPPATAARTQ